jgi:penicillin amidase
MSAVSRRRFFRHQLTALGSLIAMVVIGVPIAAWIELEGSKPRLDGHLVVSGLAAEARIERDANGNVTIEAANPLGFVHAQERFFEMDLARRMAAGELSPLVGAATVDVDLKNRHHRFRARAEANDSASLAAERAT